MSSPDDYQTRCQYLYSVRCIRRKNCRPCFEVFDQKVGEKETIQVSIPFRHLVLILPNNTTVNKDVLTVYGYHSPNGYPFSFDCAAVFLRFLQKVKKSGFDEALRILCGQCKSSILIK